MKKRFLFVLLMIWFSLQFSFSQKVYEIGIGQTSLEPDCDHVSLALAGYAAPWEGRFTVQWINKGVIPFCKEITGGDNYLYYVDGQSLFRGSLMDDYNWEKIGEAVDIRYIATEGNNIIGITSYGHLKKGYLSNRKLKWKDIGITNRLINAIALRENRLYMADAEGLFWIADISTREVKWENMNFPPLKEVVSLLVVDGKLVALTGKGVLYQMNIYKQDKWLKIGYKNGVTVVENIQKIANVNRKVYGIDKDFKLYKAEHRSKGELSARALSIKSAGKTVVIVGLDLTGINEPFTTLVKKEIFKRRGLTAASVFINSSHTHFAPVTQNWPTWQESNRLADSAYLYGTVFKAVVQAVDQALDNAKPAELFFGRGSAQIGYNRSLRDHPEMYDDAVDVIRFRYLHDKSEGYLFMAACHPVFSNPLDRFTLSANFPGVARSIIEDKKGTSRTIFLQGTAGDINPLDNSEDITGEKLANNVIEVLNLPMAKVSGPISFYLDTIDIIVDIKSREEIISFTNDERINANAMIAERNYTWVEIMLGHLQNGIKHFAMPVYVHTLNIGNWKLVGFSRETTTPYSFRIKELWPEKKVSVVGYTNDVSSYLPTHLHIERKNYEGMDSFYWYGMPDTYPLDVEERIISEVKKNNR